MTHPINRRSWISTTTGFDTCPPCPATRSVISSKLCRLHEPGSAGMIPLGHIYQPSCADLSLFPLSFKRGLAETWQVLPSERVDLVLKANLPPCRIDRLGQSETDCGSKSVHQFHTFGQVLGSFGRNNQKSCAFTLNEQADQVDSGRRVPDFGACFKWKII
jgi:hypothetical protein